MLMAEVLRRVQRLKRSKSQRGASAVEAAFIAPLFFAFIFGIFELSLYLLDVNAIRNATRIGAHEGSNSARDALADYNVIRSTLGAISNMANSIDGIIIFKAPASNSTVPAACIAALDSHSAGVANVCNVYLSYQVKTLDPLHFGFTPISNADPTLWDRMWPATGRNDSLSGTDRPDLLGVYVRAHHKSLTGVLPARVLNASVVNEIEPQRAE